MTTLAPPKVAIKLHPVPKMIVYAGLAGELLTNTGMRDSAQINALQQAMGEGLLDQIVVIGIHVDGKRDIFRMTVKPFSADEAVSLQFDPGKSHAENLDVSMAAFIQHAAGLIKRRALKPEYAVCWSTKAKAAPGGIAAALKRFNFKEWKEPAPEPLPQMAHYELPQSTPAPAAPPVRFTQAVNTYTAPPPPPAGYRYVPVISVTPAKDPGVTFSHETTLKVTQ